MTDRTYLLDTNTLSDLVRRPQGEVARAIARVGEGSVCTSVIVAAELRFGAAKSSSPRLRANVEAVLGFLDVLPFEPPADARYGEARAALEARGQSIGPNDLLIAAQVLALGLTLVTANVGEFGRVSGLHVENWLDPTSRRSMGTSQGGDLAP